VYRRWHGKDELVLAALAQLKGPIARPAGRDVRADLVYLLEHVRAQWTRGNHGRLMHRLSADGWDRPELYGQFRDRLIRPRQQVMLDVLHRGVAEGLIRAEADLWAVHDLLVSPILAAAFTHQPQPTTAQLGFMVDTVLAGLRP
jgi:AcrR family transcriptional regulator